MINVIDRKTKLFSQSNNVDCNWSTRTREPIISRQTTCYYDHRNVQLGFQKGAYVHKRMLTESIQAF
jgi:hypothetical protein